MNTTALDDDDDDGDKLVTVVPDYWDTLWRKIFNMFSFLWQMNTVVRFSYVLHISVFIAYQISHVTFFTLNPGSLCCGNDSPPLTTAN